MEGGAYKKMSHMEVQLKTTFEDFPWGKVTAIIIDAQPFSVFLMFFDAKRNECF